MLQVWPKKAKRKEERRKEGRKKERKKEGRKEGNIGTEFMILISKVTNLATDQRLA